MKPIIESTIFFDQHNIVLCGNRDGGEILAERSPMTNKGNFWELLRHVVNSDEITLKPHLESSGANATHITKTIKTESIEYCIRDSCKNLCERKWAYARNCCIGSFYSVVVDEIIDVSHKSQLTLALCYNYNCTRYEDFHSFLHQHKY